MDLVVIGRVGGPHGVAGDVRITSSTRPPENIERYRPWYLGRAGDEGSFRPVEVVSIMAHGHGYVAHISGVDDRDQAQALSGALVAVPRSALPEPEDDREYYWQDLIGMSVVNAAGEELGTVRRLLPTGAHDVLVIGDGRHEVLIPFVDVFVVDVDATARLIRVDWHDRV